MSTIGRSRDATGKPRRVSWAALLLLLPAAGSAGESEDRPAGSVRITTGVEYPLVFIEPGRFRMGRETRALALKLALNFEATRGVDEGPVRRVTITEGYSIGKYKVTCREYCRFLNAVEKLERYIVLNKLSRIALEDGDYQPKPGCERCAANTVPWDGAVAFCEWLSRRTGRTVRLPTEAEGEFAARGPEGRLYPWGNEPLDEPWQQDYGDTDRFPQPWNCEPADAFPANATPEGVVGMASGVGEWCSDYCGVRNLPHDTVEPQGPRKEDLPVRPESPLLAAVPGQYRVLRRVAWGPRVTQRESREPADEVRPDRGVYGLRIVVEAP